MKIFNVCSPRPKKDGGTYWHRIGSAFAKDGKLGIQFDSLPLQDSDGRCSVQLFERDDNRNQRQSSGGQSADTGGAFDDDLDDDVPF